MVARKLDEKISKGPTTKLDALDPTSWPVVNDKLKSSYGLGTQTSSAAMTKSQLVNKQVEVDNTKDETIKSLSEYCKTLQRRIHELEAVTVSGRLTSGASYTPLASERTISAPMTKSKYDALLSSSSTLAMRSSIFAGFEDFQRSAVTSQSTSRGGYGGVLTESFEEGHPQIFSRPTTVKFKQGTGSASRKNSVTPNNRKSVDNFASTKVNDEVERAVEYLDKKVSTLGQLFKDTNPIHDRQFAASKITASVRGWLVRLRKRKFSIALREWKWSRCKHVVHALELSLDGAASLDNSIRQMRMARDTRSKHIFFSKWERVCKQSAPMRRLMREAAEAKGRAKDSQFMRKVMRALYDVTIGKCSNKFAKSERRVLIESLRKKISAEQQAKGETGVVTEVVIMRALNLHILYSYLDKKKRHLLTEIFGAFKFVLDVTRSSDKTASKQRFRKLVGKCFFAWTEWIFMVGMGLDRKRWPGPRRYEVRYNQKLIDTFSKNRLQRMCFKPWRAFSSRLATVERRFRDRLSKFISVHFKAWAVRAMRQKIIRRLVEERWSGYAKKMITEPFYAWVSFASEAQHRRVLQDRLVRSYCRWKARQRLGVIVRTWRHQALYGRVEGLYSRSMLSRSLGEQKLLSNQLQKALATQTIELEECRDIVKREIEARRVLETKLINRDKDALNFQMINDHRDQELRRMEAIIEAMAIINPKQVKHLRELQPEFKFKHRVFDLAPPEGTGNDLVSLGGEDDLISNADSIESTSLASAANGQLEETESQRFAQAVILSESDHGYDGRPVGVTKGSAAATGQCDDKHEGSVRSKREHHDSISSVERMASSIDHSLSEEERGLLLRAKWLVRQLKEKTAEKENYFSKQDSYRDGLSHFSSSDADGYTQDGSRTVESRESRVSGDDNPFSGMLDSPNGFDEAENNKEWLDDGRGLEEDKAPANLVVSTEEGAQKAEHIEARLLVSVLDFLETGNTAALSTEDFSDYTKMIMRSVRASQAAAASSSIRTAGAILEGTWRDALLHLRVLYPVKTLKDANSGDNLEIRLGQRIMDMRSNLEKIMIDFRKKSQGLMVEEDGVPVSVYASNIRMLREKPATAELNTTSRSSNQAEDEINDAAFD